MKKYFSYAFTFWLCISVLLGCRKETTETLPADLKTEALKKIKDAYESAQKLQIPAYSNIGGQLFLVKEEPLWEEAFYSEADAITIVPIKMNIGGTDGSVQKFLVGKSEGNNKELQINKYRVLLPNNNGKYESTDDISKAYRAINSNATLNAFSGLIQKYNITGSLLSEYKYDNGQKIKLTDVENKEPDEYDGPPISTAPGECITYIIDSYWLTYVNGELVSIEYLYSTPVTVCPSTGGGGGAPNQTNIVGTTTDSYAFTCPANFTFTSVTTNNLWQEAGIKNASCNLVLVDVQTGQTTVRQLQVPIMYFGVPYYNINGGIVYTQNQAKQVSADAINYGEYKMRTYFRDHQNATTAELQGIWISEANNDLKSRTSGSGRVTKFPAINPTTPSVVNQYIGCY